jgi:hypothetical protein
VPEIRQTLEGSERIIARTFQRERVLELVLEFLPKSFNGISHCGFQLRLSSR